MTDQQLDLDAIETRKNAATPGPWERYAEYGPHFVANITGPYLRGVGDLNFGVGDQAAADEEFVKHAREDVAVMAAEIRRLRTERDELRGKFAEAAASVAEQVLRYGQRQREHNADREELEHLRTALTEIRHLHKDSPMGPCPVCIDADAAAAGGDGLVAYPCPTARLAGAKDCDPPHARTAPEEAHVVADDSSDPEHTDDCPGCETAAGQP
jgi:hypothetical protein